MTLAQAVTLFQSRVDTDQDCDFDSTDTTLCTTALMRAAERWSRDTYALWTWESTLTLAAADQSISTLGSKSAQKVFHIYGVHLNHGWLQEYRYRDFLEAFPSYAQASNSETPDCYTLTAPNNIFLNAPIATAAAALTEKYVIGFRLHATYTYASNPNDELEGPADQHELIVDRAYLDSTKSYIVGDEGFQRRNLIQQDYLTKTAKIKADNLAIYKKEVRRAGCGLTRRVRSVGVGF
jgi:hypothetical protein